MEIIGHSHEGPAGSVMIFEPLSPEVYIRFVLRRFCF